MSTVCRASSSSGNLIGSTPVEKARNRSARFNGVLNTDRQS
jgi:hypothetical protein